MRQFYFYVTLERDGTRTTVISVRQLKLSFS